MSTTAASNIAHDAASLAMAGLPRANSHRPVPATSFPWSRRAMTNAPRCRNAMAMAISVLACTSALAADDVFIKLPGIVGTSTATNEVGASQATSFQWGISASATFQTNRGIVLGKPTSTDLAWTQGSDSTLFGMTADLWRETVLPQVTLTAQTAAIANSPSLVLTASPTQMTSATLNATTGAAIVNASVSTHENFSISYNSGGQNSHVVSSAIDSDQSLKVTAPPVPTSFVAGTAGPAEGIYLRLGSAAGSVTAKGYENWIRLDSAELGITAADGAGSVGKPTVGELSFSMPVDQTVPVEAGELLRGADIPQITVEFVNAQGSAYMQLAMDTAFFNNLSVSESGGAAPEANESVVFESFSETVRDQDPDGNLGAPSGFTFDVSTGQVLPDVEASDIAGFGNGGMNLPQSGGDGPLPPAVPLPAIAEPRSWMLFLAGAALLLCANLAKRLRSAMSRRLPRRARAIPTPEGSMSIRPYAPFVATAIALSIGSFSCSAASVVFDNVSNAENGIAGEIGTTPSTPNTFMGDAYKLAAGTTSITGFDLFPGNTTGDTTFTNLKLNVYVWGHVNTGTVDATHPAFGDLLGTYSFTSDPQSFASGYYYSFEGDGISTPGFALATPLGLPDTTIGLSFNIQGSTDGGVNYGNVNNLSSTISFGTPASVGSDLFNGYYRNVNSEQDGNFTSALRQLGPQEQSVALRIYGEQASAVPEPTTGLMTGLGLAMLVLTRRRQAR